MLVIARNLTLVIARNLTLVIPAKAGIHLDPDSLAVAAENGNVKKGYRLPPG
jgi:hypothetical protein